MSGCIENALDDGESAERESGKEGGEQRDANNGDLGRAVNWRDAGKDIGQPTVMSHDEREAADVKKLCIKHGPSGN